MEDILWTPEEANTEIERLNELVKDKDKEIKILKEFIKHQFNINNWEILRSCSR